MGTALFPADGGTIEAVFAAAERSRWSQADARTRPSLGAIPGYRESFDGPLRPDRRDAPPTVRRVADDGGAWSMDAPEGPEGPEGDRL